MTHVDNNQGGVAEAAVEQVAAVTDPDVCTVQAGGPDQPRERRPGGFNWTNP